MPSPGGKHPRPPGAAGFGRLLCLRQQPRSPPGGPSQGLRPLLVTAGRRGPTCQQPEEAQTPPRDPNAFRMRSLPPPHTHARTAWDERPLSAHSLRLYADAHSTSQSRPGTSRIGCNRPQAAHKPTPAATAQGWEGRKLTTRLGRPCRQTEPSAASREPRLGPLSSPPHRKPQVFNQAKHLRHQLPAAP